MKRNSFENNIFFAILKNKKRIKTYFIVTIICFFISACAINNTGFQNKNLIVESNNDSQIVYGFSGKGDITILFVHGWLCDHTHWQNQIKQFSNAYKVAWLDLAGHGKSQTNRKNFTMASFAKDVKAVSDKIGDQKIILVGHSMGGPIVIEAAKLLKEKVIGIVAVDAFYTSLANVPEEIKLSFLEKLKKDYPSALAETVKSMFTQNASARLIDSTYENMLTVNQNVGISSLYECIKWNARKAPLEVKNWSMKLRNINGAPTDNEIPSHESVVLISNVGHFVNQVKPEEFNAKLAILIENYRTQ